MKISKAAFVELILMLLPIFGSIAINRALGPMDRGILANILLVPSVVATAVSFNWDKLLRSYLLSGVSDSTELVDVTFTIWLWQTLIGVFISSLYIFFNPDLYSGSIAFGFVSVFVVVPLQIAYNYSLSYIIATKNSEVNYSIRFVSVLCFVCAVYAFDIAGSLSLFNSFLSNQLIGFSFVLIVFLLYRKSKLNIFQIGCLNKRYFADIKKSVFPHLIESVTSQLDIFLVIRLFGFVEAGAYVAFRVLELPFKALSMAVINTSNKSTLLQSNLTFVGLAYGIVVLLILSTLYFFFGDLVVSPLNYLIGDRYSSMYWFLNYLLFVYAFSNAYDVFMNHLMVKGFRNEYSNVKLTVSLTRAATLLILSHLFGIVGVFYSLLTSYLIGIFLSLRSISKFSKASS